MSGYSTPILAQWDITTGCNFLCSFCLSCSGQRSPTELTPTQATLVLDRLHDGGVLFLRVLGGEPFFRKDLTSLLHRAAGKGMLISFSTNAALIDDNAARVIKEIQGNINYFQVSLYGTTVDGYAAVTRNPRAFDLVRRGIQCLQRHDLMPYVFWVLTEDNVAQTEVAYEFVRSAGLPALRISPKLNLGRASVGTRPAEGETPVFWGRVVNMLKTLHERVCENRSPEVQLHARPLLGEFLFRLTGIPFFFITCKAATTMVYVNASGECSPCPFADYMPESFRKDIVGRPLSLLDHHLHDIWESPLFRNYRTQRVSESGQKRTFVACPHRKSGLCEPCLFTPCTCRSSIELIQQGVSVGK